LVVTEEAGAKRRAAVFKAMAHPARLKLLEELARDEECVCHLASLMKKAQPYISQQLSSLRDAGLVEDRKDGQRTFYRLADHGVVEVLDAVRELVGEPAFQPEPRAQVPGCSCPKCS
jgi:DNA-binding transcriptional ArsR family regulator